VALIQEGLSVAHKTGALATGDLERVVVDTTVQPKAIAHPTRAAVPSRIGKIGRSGATPPRTVTAELARVAKRDAIMVGRYTPAHQFKRARRELRMWRAAMPVGAGTRG
jgi:transposase, IS5 family